MRPGYRGVGAGRAVGLAEVVGKVCPDASVRYAVFDEDGEAVATREGTACL